jgi:hypothetical protein
VRGQQDVKPIDIKVKISMSIAEVVDHPYVIEKKEDRVSTPEPQRISQLAHSKREPVMDTWPEIFLKHL